MVTEDAYPLPRERNLIVGILLILAAAAWGVVAWQSVTVRDDTMMRAGSLTMGMAAPLFLAVWVAMMVAMMFPAATPMILAFRGSHNGANSSAAGRSCRLGSSSAPISSSGHWPVCSRMPSPSAPTVSRVGRPG